MNNLALYAFPSGILLLTDSISYLGETKYHLAGISVKGWEFNGHFRVIFLAPPEL